MVTHSHAGNNLGYTVCMMPKPFRWSPAAVVVRTALPFVMTTANAIDAEAQPNSLPLIEQTGILESERIMESSGVAVSRTYQGILWTHNDSGDDPVVYAIDLSGRDHGAFLLKGASAVDWEDIALSECPLPVGPGDCLFIGDTGDNEGERDSVAIYIIREPDPSEVAPGATGSAEVARVLRLRYREGPQDVEALAVAPDGALLLITKGGNLGAKTYWLEPLPATGTTITAAVSDSLPIEQYQRLDRLVTGAAISPDGRRLVVRTYTELFFFEIARNGDRRLSRMGRPCWIGLQQIQGESVDFLDDEWVVSTSEAVLGRPGTVVKANCGRDAPLR